MDTPIILFSAVCIALIVPAVCWSVFRRPSEQLEREQRKRREALDQLLYGSFVLLLIIQSALASSNKAWPVWKIMFFAVISPVVYLIFLRSVWRSFRASRLCAPPVPAELANLARAGEQMEALRRLRLLHPQLTLKDAKEIIDDVVQAGRCPQCGYNLTDNVSNPCPECGAPTPPQ